MSINILAAGNLVKDPVQAQSKGGNPYVRATVKTAQTNREGESEAIFVSVMAFGSEGEKLGKLKAGDAVSVAGKATLGTFTNKQGNTTASLSVMASGVLTVYGVSKRRADPESSRHAQRSDGSHDPDGGAFRRYAEAMSPGMQGRSIASDLPDFNDEISF